MLRLLNLVSVTGDADVPCAGTQGAPDARRPGTQVASFFSKRALTKTRLITLPNGAVAPIVCGVPGVLVSGDQGEHVVSGAE
jgi:hypothetical protein